MTSAWSRDCSVKTSASTECRNSVGASGYDPRIDCDPMITRASAPVMFAAARMMCSSCALSIPRYSLDFVDHLALRTPREGRTLAETLPLVGRVREDPADLRHGTAQDLTPLVVGPEQARRVT